MKKLILILIKLIPLYTLYRGVLGGKNRLGPVLNIGKTIFTQYEMKKMMGTLIVHYKESQGELILGPKLSSFLNENFSDQYSGQVRSLVGNNSEDLSVDIWNSKYTTVFDYDSEDYILKSAGPDQELDTKDDIEMKITIQGASQYLRKDDSSQKQIEAKPQRDEYQENNTQQTERQYNDLGFDQYGYDREGYNEEGYNREGFDRDGYNSEGIHKDDLHLYEN